MGLFNIFRKKENIFKEKVENLEPNDNQENNEQQLGFIGEMVKNLYENPETLVEIEFANRIKNSISIWIEPACITIDLDDETEYKIVSHDRNFRMEFDENNHVVFYLEYSFGFKLYKRFIYRKDSSQSDWELKLDLSDINF